MKEKVRKLGKLLKISLPGAIYSCQREYMLLVNALIGCIGVFIVMDGLLGKNSLQNGSEMICDFFQSIEYFQSIIPLYLIAVLTLSLLNRQLSRIIFVSAASADIIVKVCRITEESIWKSILLTYLIYYISVKIMKFLEHHANKKGYSILNPESVIKIRTLQEYEPTEKNIMTEEVDKCC